MICLTEKTAMGVAGAMMALSGVAIVPAAPTVIGSVAAWGGLVVGTAGYIAAGMSLADCLDAHDRGQDAATLRERMDTLQREIDAIKLRLRAS